MLQHVQSTPNDTFGYILQVPVEQVLFYTVIALCTVSSTLVVFFLIQT